MSYKVKVENSKQKHENGTIVYVNVTSPMKRHFTSNTFAIVKDTYAGQFGGSNHHSYTLIIKEANGKWNTCSWYDESEITPIEDEFLCKEIEQDFQHNYKK